MRSEEEIFRLILQTAEADERIRAVIVNGSRANPSQKKDRFQDFDIVYIVTDTAGFISDPTWIGVFGERLILQTPQTMLVPEPIAGDDFSYLMLFKDGNRIDLTLVSLAKFESNPKQDSQSICLLDKDGIVPPLPAASDRDYHIPEPAQKEFTDCCNEFWWINTYVAKSLWREEITNAMANLNGPVREMLMKMLEWYAGTLTNFTVSAGKHGKYLQNYLQPEIWRRLLDTYPQAESKQIWKALFAMGKLFRELALAVAAHSGLDYNIEEDENVNAFLASESPDSP